MKSILFDNFLDLSRLYKFDPFLKNCVSGEFIYFAKKLFSLIDLPPIAITSPDIFLIGKIILSRNLSIFLLSLAITKPVSSSYLSEYPLSL